LVEAGQAPLLQRGKVQKPVFHRPLHFVGKRPGEEYARGVGVDALYGCRGRVIGLGPTHEIKEFFLLGIGLSHWFNHSTRSACPLGHRTLGNPQKKTFHTWPVKVNSLTSSRAWADPQDRPARASRKGLGGQGW